MTDLANVQMVVSISKQYPNLKSDLKDLANEAQRSLSNYITLILLDHVRKSSERKEIQD